jgi:hypothetical protein
VIRSYSCSTGLSPANEYQLQPFMEGSVRNARGLFALSWTYGPRTGESDRVNIGREIFRDDADSNALAL